MILSISVTTKLSLAIIMIKQLNVCLPLRSHQWQIQTYALIKGVVHFQTQFSDH